MISGHADLGNDTTLTLKQAILLYSNGNSYTYNENPRTFATIHNTRETDNNQPELEAGRLLTRGDLEQIYEALRGKQSLSLLPPHVLAASSDAVAWHEPAQERTLFFNTRDDSLNNISGTYPQPPLLWIHDGPGLSVYALKSNDRPTGDTPLFFAPYYNTYQAGNICLGSTALPKHHDPNRTSEVSDAFFRSAFTHASGHQRHYQIFGGSMSELWQHVRELGHFPTQYLVPTGKTLQDAISTSGRRY